MELQSPVRSAYQYQVALYMRKKKEGNSLLWQVALCLSYLYFKKTNLLMGGLFRQFLCHVEGGSSAVAHGKDHGGSTSHNVAASIDFLL